VRRRRGRADPETGIDRHSNDCDKAHWISPLDHVWETER
jgi:hypothetical protein